MPELAQLIRDYYEAVADPVEVEEILNTPVGDGDGLLTSLEPISPRRTWRVAMAAAAIVVLLVGGAVWVANLPDGADTAKVSTTEEVSATAEVSTTGPTTGLPEFDTSIGEWALTRAPIEAGPDSAIYDALAAPGIGYVGVGSDGGRATVWLSLDGVSWMTAGQLRVGGGVEFTFGDPEGVHMTSVTTGGPGFVAVGGHMGDNEVVDEDDRCVAGESVFCDEETIITPATGGASVWTSVDGFEWDRVHHDSSTGGALMTAVTAGGPGFVAVGWSPSPLPEDPYGEHGYGAVWTSTDGLSWERVPDDAGVFEGERIHDVIAGPEGLIAVGSKVWKSPDGHEWTLVDELVDAFYEPGHDSRGIRSVTRGGPGFVGVGWGGSLWTSTDGSSWARVPGVEETFGTTHLNAVARSASGLVAAAEFSLGGPGGVWTSTDGFTWVQVATIPVTLEDLEERGRGRDGPEGPEVILLDEDRFILLGRSPYNESDALVEEPFVAAVWVGTLGPPPAPSRAEALADGLATVTAMLDAYNQGTPDEWLAFFPVPETLGAGGSTLEVELSTLAANGTWLIDGNCTLRSSAQLECPTVRRDDFHGAGGLELRIPYTFTFADGQVLFYEAGGNPGPDGDWFDIYYEFSGAFRDWLETAHPTIADEVAPPLHPAFDPSDMETMLEYMDEFVAQSDTYPVDPVG